MKEVKLSKKTTLVQAAMMADLIPETTEVFEKIENGVILKGKSVGNYREIFVKVIFEEKEKENGRIKVNNDIGTSG